MKQSEPDGLERYLAAARTLREVDGKGARLVGTFSTSPPDPTATVAYSIGIYEYHDRYELRLTASARGPPDSRSADLLDWINTSVLPDLREDVLRATRNELSTPTHIKPVVYRELEPAGPWQQVPGTATFATTAPKRRQRALSDALISIVAYLPGRVDVYRLEDGAPETI
jgi:hypothetical protein